MNKRIYRMSLLSAFLALGLCFIDGCRKKDRLARIRIVGSTSVFPFAEMLAEAYEQVRPQIEVDVQAGGSTVGINAAHDGTADIGTSSRSLRDEEKNGVKIIEIARDGIAVVVHPSNDKVQNLSQRQIRSIYTNYITNWKDIGGDDEQILCVTREEGSGTRGAFEDIIMEGARIAAQANVQDSNGSVREVVANNPYAIGYISLALVNEKVKAVAVDNVSPSEASLSDGSYPVVRPFLFVVKGEPAGEVKKFIDFVLSDAGQSVLKKEGLLSPTRP